MHIRIVGQGWDNVIARLGDRLALRVPRHAVGDRLLRNEQRWLSYLAPSLPLPVPAPVRLGIADARYPFVWSVNNWIEGEAADLSPPDDAEAIVFPGFLRALHKPAPGQAPSNAHRDCPLTAKQAATEKRMDTLRRVADSITAPLEAIWHRGLETRIDLNPVWIAGDIHARNVVVHQGRLAAIVDWGDICVGDPATDLAGIWALFDNPNARRAAIEAYEMSEETLARAMGWAVFMGVILQETGLQDTPRHAVMGADMLRRLACDHRLLLSAI